MSGPELDLRDEALTSERFAGLLPQLVDWRGS
jgi:hypothetical protein